MGNKSSKTKIYKFDTTNAEFEGIPENLIHYVRTNDFLDNLNIGDFKSAMKYFKKLAQKKTAGRKFDVSYINYGYRHILFLAKQRIPNSNFYVSLYRKLISKYGNKLCEKFENIFFKEINEYQITDSLQKALITDDLNNFHKSCHDHSNAALLKLAARYGSYNIFEDLWYHTRQLETNELYSIRDNVIAGGNIEIAKLVGKNDLSPSQALKYRQMNMFEFLLEREPEDFDPDFVYSSVQSDDLRQLIWVLQRTLPDKYGDIHREHVLAASEGSVLCLRYLVEQRNADLSSFEPFGNRNSMSFALLNNDIIMVKYLLEKNFIQIF